MTGFNRKLRNASLNSGVWKLRGLAKGLRYRCA